MTLKNVQRAKHWSVQQLEYYQTKSQSNCLVVFIFNYLMYLLNWAVCSYVSI